MPTTQPEKAITAPMSPEAWQAAVLRTLSAYMFPLVRVGRFAM